MAEADLSPTTFTVTGQPVILTMTFPLRILLKKNPENTYTEATSDNSSSDPEKESNAKSEVRRSSTMPKPI